MTYEVRRFDLLAVFKVCFLVYLVVGFLLGLFYGLILMKMISAIGPLLDTPVFDDFESMTFFAAIALAVFMAVFLAVIWSIITVIAAGIYNVIAGMVGGIKMELAEITLPVYQQQMPPPPPQPAVPPEGGGSSV
jgi:hypothetical protein